MQILNELNNLFSTTSNSAENLDFYKKLFSIQADSTCKDIYDAISSKNSQCTENEVYNLPVFQLESYFHDFSTSKVSHY